MGKGAGTKGYMKNLSTGGIKKFIYNPSTFETTRGMDYAEISAPGSSYPHFQYSRGGNKSIRVDLFLRDKAWQGETKSYIDFIEGLTPKEDSTSKFKKPPLVLFAFGSFVEKCIVVSVGVKYEDFDSSLNPTQATVSLELVVVK